MLTNNNIEYNNLEENILTLNDSINICFNCELCNDIYFDEIALQDHIIIMHDRIYENIYECDSCNCIFNSSDALENHYILQHQNNNNNEILPEINANITCPNCNLLFENANLLGEHFINNHQTYDDFCKLDCKTSFGYPSLDILENVGMIQFLGNNDIKCSLDDICNICCNQYSKEYNNNTKYMSKILENKIKNVYLDDNIKDNDNDEPNNIYPILTKCCKKTLCVNCLKSHLVVTQNIICPLCTVDHSITERKYVDYITPNGKTNDSWNFWWLKHVNIFL
jgi:uncharacterized C2H2 Zn-finger protein